MPADDIQWQILFRDGAGNLESLGVQLCHGLRNGLELSCRGTGVNLSAYTFFAAVGLYGLRLRRIDFFYRRLSVSLDHRIYGPVKNGIQFLVGDYQPLGLNIGIERRARVEFQNATHARHREKHSAALAPAMTALLPFVLLAEGDLAVGQNLIVGDSVYRLKLLNQIADRVKLLARHNLIVIADALDADRIFIDLLLRVPHRTSRMERYAVTVDDLIDSSRRCYAVMAEPPFGNVSQRAFFGGFGRMENYEFRRLSYLALLVALAPIAFANADAGHNRRREKRKRYRNEYAAHQTLRTVLDQGSLPARSEGVVISAGTGMPSI